MRERKLRSAAESLLRLRGSFISYILDIYKLRKKVKGKKHNTNLLTERPRLKHEWNHTVGSVNNLGCGIAGLRESELIITAKLERHRRPASSFFLWPMGKHFDSGGRQFLGSINWPKGQAQHEIHYSCAAAFLVFLAAAARAWFILADFGLCLLSWNECSGCQSRQFALR